MGVINPLLAAHALKEQAKNTRKYGEKLVKRCLQIEAMCDSFIVENSAKEAADFDDKGAWLSSTIALVGEARLYSFCIYEELTKPQTFSNQIPAGVAAVDAFLCFNDQIERIFTTVVDGILYIKLPLLWTKYAYKSRMNGNFVRSDYLHWFTRNLDTSLSMIADKMPHFKEKNIHFMYVISCDRVDASDTDSYDTKAIIDTIASHTLGGDGAFVCSHSACSIREDNLPEGTYITVSPNFGMTPVLHENVQRWNDLLIDIKNS